MKRIVLVVSDDLAMDVLKVAARGAKELHIKDEEPEPFMTLGPPTHEERRKLLDVTPTRKRRRNVTRTIGREEAERLIEEAVKGKESFGYHVVGDFCKKQGLPQSKLWFAFDRMFREGRLKRVAGDKANGYLYAWSKHGHHAHTMG